MARSDAIKKIHALLLKRRNAMREALAGDLSLLKELRDQQGSDSVDVALDAAQDEISSRLAEVESRELAQIERALEEIEEGTYGTCEACETKIPLQRLKALPYATLCISCQREAELEAGGAHGDADWSRILDTDSGADYSFNDIELDVP